MFTHYIYIYTYCRHLSLSVYIYIYIHIHIRIHTYTYIIIGDTGVCKLSARDHALRLLSPLPHKEQGRRR